MSTGRTRRGWPIAAALLLAASTARAERPTEGGLFAFEPDDVVVTHDEPGGGVRVHYTLAGANAVPSLEYVVQVGETAVAALELYAETLGLRPPVSETELGLMLGGSAAFDIYLVDFGGAADGHFLVDECEGPRCAGAFVMENDFAGYGYADVTAAIDTVVSHELFHAVQAAYSRDAPVWFSEGTATWAERRFRADSRDFLALCDRFLQDTGRSLFRPPSGPVPAFAYGTALWWDFLVARHGDEIVEALLVASEGDLLTGMAAAIVGNGDALATAWLEFVAWNLATGPRAGALPGHEFAAELAGITPSSEGPEIEDEARVFSLSAQYHRLTHAGGPLWFGLAASAAPLRFALHPVVGGAQDGPVGPATLQWDATQAGARELAELPAGGYWLTVAHPEVSTASTQARLCLGDEVAARRCVDDAVPVPEPESEPEPEPMSGTDGACDCRGGPPPSLAWLLLIFSPGIRRRSPRVARALS